MDKAAFSDKRRRDAAMTGGQHGAIAGQFVDDPEAFARAVMVHELGHALQMQNATVLRRGQELAIEKVARDGVKLVPAAPVGTPQQRFYRWEVDTLNEQSVYATGNKFEWFAEAFADGWFNGDNATDSGKRALAIVREAYGSREKVAA
jgi:hypothetical protein